MLLIELIIFMERKEFMKYTALAILIDVLWLMELMDLNNLMELLDQCGEYELYGCLQSIRI